MLTLQQAANATGKAKSTIQRAIKSGRLSAKRLDSGSYEIDPAELSRVYLLRATGSAIDSMKHDATQQCNSETELLQLKLELLQMQLEQSIDTITDLRQRLDAADSERRQLMQILTHQTNTTLDKPETLFGKLFKR